MEYRMIDHDMFDETMIEEINGLTKRGWKIIRILDPMKWLNSDGMFIRIFYEREQKTSHESAALPLHDVMPSHLFLHTHGDGSDGNEWGVLGIYYRQEDALNAANNYEYDSDVETWDVQ